MKKAILVMALISLTGLVAVSICVGECPLNYTTSAKTAETIYDFSLKNIDGKQVEMEQYAGKVLLIVNVASRCGYTPQYEGLEAVYRKYQEQGLVILGFPANNFMGQEPGTDAEIKTFCSTKYNVTFPIFSKISVKGVDQHPFYKYLTAEETNPRFAGEVTWNFNKFLVDRTGRIVGRFDAKEKPESEKIIRAIEQALR